MNRPLSKGVRENRVTIAARDAASILKHLPGVFSKTFLITARRNFYWTPLSPAVTVK